MTKGFQAFPSRITSAYFLWHKYFPLQVFFGYIAVSPTTISPVPDSKYQILYLLVYRRLDSASPWSHLSLLLELSFILIVEREGDEVNVRISDF